LVKPEVVDRRLDRLVADAGVFGFQYESRTSSRSRSSPSSFATTRRACRRQYPQIPPLVSGSILKTHSEPEGMEWNPGPKYRDAL